MMKKLNILFFLLLVVGCSTPLENETKEDAKDEKQTLVMPSVTDERKDLLLSWFADGGSVMGSSVADVPIEARKEVRVQDPKIPPEKRNNNLVFLSDLTAPKINNQYQVKAIKRKTYEAIHRKALAPTESRTAKQSKHSVIMYATKHCPVCVKARRWLLEQKIPYTEFDLETNPDRAKSLALKGKKQGVSTNGVPIFEINGQLLPGLNKEKILQILLK